MTSQIIQSNNTSEILRSLQELSSTDRSMGYQMPPSYPILAKTCREIQSNNVVSGAAAGQEVVFNVNKAMLLRNMQIRKAFSSNCKFMKIL